MKWMPSGMGVMAMLAALGGCSPAVSEAPGAVSAQPAELHPESRLEVVTLFVHSGEKKRRFRVEMARSRFEQAKGLMFRTAMGPDEGMLFPFDKPRQASFWMRNTVIPLDLIFIGADRRILNVFDNAEPYSENQIISEGQAIAVLELNGGRAGQLGIKAGDRVEW